MNLLIKSFLIALGLLNQSAHAVKIYVDNRYENIPEKLGLCIVAYKEAVMGTEPYELNINIKKSKTNIFYDFLPDSKINYINIPLTINEHHEMMRCQIMNVEHTKSLLPIMPQDLRTIHIVVEQDPKNPSEHAWPIVNAWVNDETHSSISQSIQQKNHFTDSEILFDE